MSRHSSPLRGTLMISEQQIHHVIGSTAVGHDGDKLGKVGEVYLDDQTGRPEWATVHTGLFGTHETFVPLSDATVSGGTLRVPYEKAKVRTPRGSTRSRATSPPRRRASSTATTASARAPPATPTPPPATPTPSAPAP